MSGERPAETSDTPPHLFLREGNVWHPQPSTVGPWSPEALHGGPVAALCVSVAEEVLPDPALVTSRLTLDLIRPVPTRPLVVEGRILKSGRRVNLVEIELSDAGVPVALALVQRTSVNPVELPELTGTGAELVPPHDRPGDFHPLKFSRAPFATLASEIRTARPEGFSSRYPTDAWIRVFAELLPGRPLSTAAAAAAAADYGNALGAPLAPAPFTTLFPNADLTVYLARTPASGWVRMSPASTWLEHGIGHTRCALADELGMLGTVTVTLVLADPPGK